MPATPVGTVFNLSPANACRALSPIWVKTMKLGLLMSLLLLLCQASPAAQGRTDSTEAEILEIVFRYQIAHRHKPHALRKYFLSYKGQDLSDALMARFKSDGSRIKTRSQMSGFKDRDTGERGSGTWVVSQLSRAG